MCGGVVDKCFLLPKAFSTKPRLETSLSGRVFRGVSGQSHGGHPSGVRSALSPAARRETAVPKAVAERERGRGSDTKVLPCAPLLRRVSPLSPRNTRWVAARLRLILRVPKKSVLTLFASFSLFLWRSQFSEVHALPLSLTVSCPFLPKWL